MQKIVVIQERKTIFLNVECKGKIVDHQQNCSFTFHLFIDLKHYFLFIQVDVLITYNFQLRILDVFREYSTKKIDVL